MANPVTTAPNPLMVARCRQPGGRVRHQWTTNPVWERVKPVNTPMANSGISSLVLPPTATNKAPERTASTQMPLEKTWRSPRKANRWGR